MYHKPLGDLVTLADVRSTNACQAGRDWYSSMYRSDNLPTFAELIDMLAFHKHFDWITWMLISVYSFDSHWGSVFKHVDDFATDFIDQRRERRQLWTGVKDDAYYEVASKFRLNLLFTACELDYKFPVKLPKYGQKIYDEALQYIIEQRGDAHA